MICISPSAPRGDMACALPLLSTWMTAQIQRSGIANLCEASAMNAAYAFTGDGFDVSEACARDATSALPVNGTPNVSRTPKQQAVVPRTVVRAAVGNAHSLRPCQSRGVSQHGRIVGNWAGMEEEGPCGRQRGRTESQQGKSGI